MAKKAYARRYAEAVFEIAREKNELDKWRSDLEKITAIIEDGELMAWLENPRFRFQEKAKIVSERLPGLNPLALNLVHLLLQKGRLGIIPKIADQYERFLDNYRGIEHAAVTTAIPLTDQDMKTLKERLSQIMDRQIVLSSQVDPDIIGGIVIRINGKLLDGSTRGQLLALKQDIAGSGT